MRQLVEPYPGVLPSLVSVDAILVMQVPHGYSVVMVLGERPLMHRALRGHPAEMRIELPGLIPESTLVCDLKRFPPEQDRAEPLHRQIPYRIHEQRERLTTPGGPSVYHNVYVCQRQEPLLWAWLRHYCGPLAPAPIASVASGRYLELDPAVGAVCIHSPSAPGGVGV